MSEKITYLLVEDEVEYRNTLAAELHLSPWETEILTADDGKQAQEVAQGNPQIDLVVLDLNLNHKIYGMTVLKWFSDNTDIPVVILSTDNSPERKIQAFNLGAVAYLDKFRESKSSKGFDLSQIRRYLEGYLRRKGQSKIRTKIYSFGGGWVLDPDRRYLRDPKKVPIPLSGVEFDLLLMFVEKPRVVLTQEELIAELELGNTKDPKNNLNQKISRLRGKLRRSKANGGDESALIVNSYGGGFYFAADVKTVTS
ncbi:MAG: response regulator transcription factor [Paracoccaceae bacterium]|nr:response regulator transcription factor [Paracoccaceae bacterium]